MSQLLFICWMWLYTPLILYTCPFATWLCCPFPDETACFSTIWIWAWPHCLLWPMENWQMWCMQRPGNHSCTGAYLFVTGLWYAENAMESSWTRLLEVSPGGADMSPLRTTCLLTAAEQSQAVLDHPASHEQAQTSRSSWYIDSWTKKKCVFLCY